MVVNGICFGLMTPQPRSKFQVYFLYITCQDGGVLYHSTFWFQAGLAESNIKAMLTTVMSTFFSSA